MNGKGKALMIVTVFNFLESTQTRIFPFFFGMMTIGLDQVVCLTGQMNPTFNSLSISSLTRAA